MCQVAEPNVSMRVVASDTYERLKVEGSVSTSPRCAQRSLKEGLDL
jgi:hypothetical protein